MDIVKNMFFDSVYRISLARGVTEWAFCTIRGLRDGERNEHLAFDPSVLVTIASPETLPGPTLEAKDSMPSGSVVSISVSQTDNVDNTVHPNCGESSADAAVVMF